VGTATRSLKLSEIDFSKCIRKTCSNPSAGTFKNGFGLEIPACEQHKYEIARRLDGRG
jgi:hypothetical protein